ncbi:MAG TPA: 16S rRNA (uracil(1498)-N(3))-methyltransferase [Woeseiaceae bacterium]|nr:16S rRNA (uracil(1498)-N(3))-methyltransferase [Woeseiaceae bacterium]
MNARLFVSDRLGNGPDLRLAGEKAHYVGRVLRLKVGDALHVFNGDDGEWRATVAAMTRDSVLLEVGTEVAVATESPLRVHLVQGVSRGERMDFVVQKATELGVKRITPVFTDHGVVKLDAQRSAKRREHWQRIAESACEQSGRVRPPLVDAPLPLNDWFGAGYAADSVQLVLTPDARAALTAVALPRPKLCLLVGPEGGFSERERADAGAAGFSAVALGPRILRTESAALAAVAVAQALWGDLGRVP